MRQDGQTTDAAPSGGLVVPAGAAQPGSVILVHGPVDVYGTVHGNVLTVFGDVVVHPGAQIDGSAASLFGHATRPGAPATAGWSFGSLAATTDAAPGSPPTLAAALGVPLGWFVLLAAMGAAVTTRADRQLRAVRAVVEQHPARAFAAGVLGQLLVVPGLIVVSAAFAATLIGVVAVPLVIVIYTAAAAGLATLGFLATATVLGRALLTRTGGAHRLAPPSRSPVPVLFGLGVFLALWLVTGALAGAGVPIATLVVRTLAVAATWIGLSAGFGAALLTRAGTHVGRRRAPGAADTIVTEQGVIPVWQTPTPIATLVAARPRSAATPVTTGRLD